MILFYHALSSFSVFYCLGHTRALHSFPTRRSSDLSHQWRSASICGQNCFRGLVARRGVQLKNFGGFGGRQHRMVCLPVTLRRSEEHTSELQSLRHLVCRLLLEKKKTTYHS